MCGIFGIIASNYNPIGEKKLITIAKKLFLLSESRGKEAAGFATISENKNIVYKTPFPASRLVKSKEYKTVFNHLFSSSNPVQGFIGHSRLVTDGYEHENRNNQPVIKKDMIVVHNGIIVNKKKLWNNYQHIKRETELDSELIPVILHEYMAKNYTESQAFQRLFTEIYGMTNIALLMSSHNNLFLSTNNGSIYFLFDKTKACFLFASERYILKKLVQDLKLQNSFAVKSITQLEPMTALSVSFTDITLSLNILRDSKKNFTNILKSAEKRKICKIENETKPVFINASLEHKNFKTPQELIDEYEKRREKMKALKRCSKCLLLETFPFIEFDEKGECNYCCYYKPVPCRGLDAFCEYIEKFRSKTSAQNCLIPFSGGRDSSYLLHIVVKELGLKPLAYSYDWGMLTDLARRNQARMCGKLGVEHILISADIRRKRKNIHKNVLAWLKRPNLGTIPLFMAGDKQYFYYANLLMSQNDLQLSILGENMLENTKFKSGFCGIKPNFGTEHTYTLSMKDKIKMMAFYSKEYLLNPAFINSSLLDTLDAFRSYYVMEHKNVNIYEYLKWDEKIIEATLINQYDWETDPGTRTTWRIGDGTVAFYNYIYYMIAGFTENDTFRSNQIREGLMSRQEAIEIVKKDNQPRFDSIKWYCDTIDIDFLNTLERINHIPKLYSNKR